jgi:hypothetical protein
MKIVITTLFCMAAFAIPVSNLSAQQKPFPEMKFPELPYKPTIKKGWVGQFVYRLNFNDSTGTGKGKTRVYYHLIINRTNSGYVELSSEIRGAIRSNQPDKNNGQRYESWINSGTKNSWNQHDETDTIIAPTGKLGTDGIIGRLEKYYRYTSDSNWVKGWINNTDLQIDHSTGKYSFAVPLIEYNLEGDETIIDIVYTPAKKDTRKRRDNKQHRLTNISYLGAGEWNLLEGDFKEGQQEIIIRERIPVSLEQTHNNKKLPVKKGFIDFYLVLKKVG